MTAIHLQSHFASSRRHPGRRDAIDALGDAAHWALVTLREWRRRSRDRREIARLDDRMLLDIGLNRADAEFLINKPFWRE